MPIDVTLTPAEPHAAAATLDLVVSLALYGSWGVVATGLEAAPHGARSMR